MTRAIANNALSGRTALVTGGSRNLGRAIAVALAGAGADVAVTARSAAAEAEETAELIRAEGSNAFAVTGDVGDPAAVEEIVAKTTEALGPIDILVSNASQRPRVNLLDLTVEEWDEIIRMNLSASFYLSRLLLGGMRDRGHGRIILIGGPDGQRPERFQGAAHRAHCNTSKAGILGLMKAIAVEFGADGITANAVIPGLMDTTRDLQHYPHWPIPQEELERRLWTPRLGQPEEVADMCTFLATESAAYVTGQTMHVSGGYLTP